MHIGIIAQSVVNDILLRKEVPEIPTTLSALDKATWGLHKGELFIIGGRPGEGKTSLAVQIAYNISINKNIVFISLEMTKEQIIERIICNEYSLASEMMRSGKCKADVQSMSEAILNSMKERKMIILDDTGRTPETLEKAIEGLSPMPDVIFIDHLQQISVRKMNRLESLDEYVQFLKTFALKNNVAIVLVSQLNRSAEEDSRPYLYHLKGCGSIEEIADVIILIWNHENETTLLIEKQRHGAVGRLEILFDKEFFRFSNKTGGSYANLNQRPEKREDSEMWGDF